MPEANDSFVIKNKLGMHARAAAVFVQLSTSFASEISVGKEDLVVNGKSIMSVLQLAAVQGDVIMVSARGDDSAQALRAIGELIGNLFGEGE